MIALLLLLIPLLGGIVTFFLKSDNTARNWSLLTAIATLLVAFLGLAVYNKPGCLSFHADWIQPLGASFALKLDGLGYTLSLLGALALPLIFVATWHRQYANAKNFFGWMLLGLAGMLGVFMAMDALLFYFFWELALIPMYFICSQWGGEKRIPVTFKFFIYTFFGSVLMLVALIYIYFQTPNHSFAIEDFYKAGQALSYNDQMWLFWLLFIAFAVKMPIFPFHTWQPDTYEQSPTAATMVLSGIMVKMGVLGLLRWVLPIVPQAAYSWGDLTSSMAVIGIIYASLIAMRQDDMKRLIAYSSIAHIGLMAIAIFSETQSSFQGVMIQMFNHGINIIALWMVVEIIERQFGTRKMSELGGLAQKAPVLAIFFVLFAFANIALPLTNAFVGEFLMFNGILNSKVTNYNVVFTVLAGLGIILGAVYTLRMTRKVFYGPANALTENAVDIKWNEKIILSLIAVVIIVMGVYPQPALNFTQAITDELLKQADILHLLKK